MIPELIPLSSPFRDSSHGVKIVVTNRTIPLMSDGTELLAEYERRKEVKGLTLNHGVEYLRGYLNSNEHKVTKINLCVLQ